MCKQIGELMREQVSDLENEQVDDLTEELTGEQRSIGLLKRPSQQIAQIVIDRANYWYETRLVDVPVLGRNQPAYK